MAPAEAAPRRVPPTLRPQQADDAPAVRAFNDRLVASGAEIPFPLSESVGDGDPLGKRSWLLLDGDVVRGGVLLTTHRALVRGQVTDVVNVQAPLTESIADARYASLAVWLFRELQRRFEYVYAVGMGATDRPLPRLLSSLKWQVGLSAFRFVPLHPGRVASSMSAIRTRIPALVRPIVPVAGAVAGVAYRAALRVRGGRALVEVVDGQAAADAVARAWSACANAADFAVDRDAAAAALLFGAADGERVLAWPDEPACAAVVRTRALTGASPFAGLRVATVLELLAPDASRRTRLSRAVLAHLAAHGADIAITNATHAATIAALDATGWLRAPSNYVVALSPAFAQAGVTLDACHVTRTDGDGRLNI